MTTILVVDDEPDLAPLLTSWFRRKIQEQTYAFRFAANGREALTLLDEDPSIEVVLTDINMPEMDGLTLLSELPARNPLLRAVMVSAYGDPTTLRTAMNRGAFDFITKPINRADLERTVEKTIQHVNRLRAEQEQTFTDALKTRFFDNITHEFRTPLTLILAPVRRMLSEPLAPEVVRRHLQTVEHSANQLLRLINQLLDLAKLESGYLDVTPAPGDLGAFVGQLVGAFAPVAEAAGLRLSYQQEGVGYHAFDAEKVGQIVYNLVANALKFTVEGGVTVTLRVLVPTRDTQRTDTDTLRLTVTDTGVGIDPKKIPYVFNRFYQANFTPPASRLTGTGEIQPGTGIGLALIRELAERMGGTITVQSTMRQADGERPTEPSGTTFTVDLPMRPVAADLLPDPLHPDGWVGSWAMHPELPDVRVPEQWKHSAGGPAAGGVIDSGDPNRPLVLVVEDNGQLRDFLAEILADAYRVLTAPNGLDAWTLARAELPDVVVSDVMMPGMDGFELTHRLKSDPDTDHIPVILLTAKSNQSSRLEGLTQGADEYLTKPFLPDELRLRLRNLLTRQQKLREHERQALNRPDGPTPMESVSDAFLRRVYVLLDAHLDDSALSVDALADWLAMSRKTLYRKVMNLTQLAPNELIRRYRLRQAAALLRAGYNVSETAYRVGFETPAYFGKCFKEVYGFAPSEWPDRPGFNS